MTTRLKKLIDRIEYWPKQAQEDAANALRAIEEEFLGEVSLSSEDIAALERSAEDMRLGRLIDLDTLRERINRSRNP